MTNLLNTQSLESSGLSKDSVKRGLSRLSSDSLGELHKLLLLRQWIADPNNFIFSGVVKTKDEHDSDTPVKAFLLKIT